MELFETVQKFYRLLGLHPSQQSPNSIFNMRNILVLYIFVEGFTSTAAFGLFGAKSIAEFGNAFYAFITELLCFVYFSNNMGKMTNVLELIEKSRSIIQKRMQNSQSKQMYNEMSEKIEKVSEILYFVLVKMTVPGVLLPSCLITIYNYFILDLKDESFFLPFPIAVPYNWKTPSGYLFALFGETLTAFYSCVFLSSLICFSLGYCYMLISFVEDITKDISLLNEAKPFNGSRTKIWTHFCSIIQFHSDAKQYVDEFCEIYGLVNTGIFLWTTTSICSSLLVFQNVSNTFDLISALFLGFWSFVTIFLFCEVGEQVTERFMQFNVELEQCCWYSFPVELQRMLVTLMANTQQPVVIRGFGSAFCTRNNFNKTVKGGFSYFMMLRQVDK